MLLITNEHNFYENYYSKTSKVNISKNKSIKQWSKFWLTTKMPLGRFKGIFKPKIFSITQPPVCSSSRYELQQRLTHKNP
jgi:hypothetical protein